MSHEKNPSPEQALAPTRRTFVNGIEAAILGIRIAVRQR